MTDYTVTNSLEGLMSGMKIRTVNTTNIHKFPELDLCLHEHLFVSFNALVHNLMLGLVALTYIYHATFGLQKPLGPS